MKKLLSHSAVVFPVLNPLESAIYYCDILGFEITFKWEDPPTYVVVKRDDVVSIHFTKKEGNFKPPENHVSLAIFVNDIDALYEEYQKSGANITTPIDNREYGMRDFDITDPNGFIISFGMGIEA